jgi:hypothetical protein
MKSWRIALAAAAGTAALIGTAQAITDTAFTYSPAKTGFYTIGPRDMNPLLSSTVYSVDNGGVHVTTAGFTCFAAGVHLPNGAKIGQVAVWYRSAGGGQGFQFHLQRTQLSIAFPQPIVSKNVVDISTNSKAVAATPTDTTTTTVSNGSYVYDFQFCANANDVAFQFARFTYTFTNAGD